MTFQHNHHGEQQFLSPPLFHLAAPYLVYAIGLPCNFLPGRKKLLLFPQSWQALATPSAEKNTVHNLHILLQTTSPTPHTVLNCQFPSALRTLLMITETKNLNPFNNSTVLHTHLGDLSTGKTSRSTHCTLPDVIQFCSMVNWSWKKTAGRFCTSVTFS